MNYWKILSLTKKRTEDIISTRSKVYQKLAIDLDDLKLEELLALIEQYPNLLKRPIIVDGDKLQVGYNEDDIRKFVPRNIRKVIFKKRQKDLLLFNYHQKFIRRVRRQYYLKSTCRLIANCVVFPSGNQHSLFDFSKRGHVRSSLLQER